MPDRWRLGSRNPFTVYRVADGAHDVDHAREHFVCAFRREEDARRAVDAVNARADPSVQADDESDLVGAVGLLRHVVQSLISLRNSERGPTALYADLVIDLNAALGKIEPHRCVPAPSSCDCPTTDAAAHLTLVSNPDRVGGDVTIGHSRLTVATVAALLRRGLDAEQIAGHYPDVTPEQAGLLARLVRDLDGQGGTAGSAVGQRGAPTRDDLIMAFRHAKVVKQEDDSGAETWIPPVYASEAERMADVALAALRDGGADTGGEDTGQLLGDAVNQLGKYSRAYAEAHEALERVEGLAFGDTSGERHPGAIGDRVEWVFEGDTAVRQWAGSVGAKVDLTGRLAVVAPRAAKAVADERERHVVARLARALGVSLDPDDPDPVGRLVEAAGKAREVEVVSGAEATELPVGSIVVRDYTEHDYVQWGWKLPSTRFPMTKTPEGFREHVHDHRPDELASNFRFRVLYRAPAPAPAALAVGEVVESAADLDRRASVGTVVEDDTDDLGALRSHGWVCQRVVAQRSAEVLDFPVTVVRVGTGGGES